MSKVQPARCDDQTSTEETVSKKDLANTDAVLNSFLEFLKTPMVHDGSDDATKKVLSPQGEKLKKFFLGDTIWLEFNGNYLTGEGDVACSKENLNRLAELLDQNVDMSFYKDPANADKNGLKWFKYSPDMKIQNTEVAGLKKNTMTRQYRLISAKVPKVAGFDTFTFLNSDVGS